MASPFEIDISALRGLKTDLPPDRLGEHALHVLNMIPRSNSSVMPRYGTSLVAKYQPLNVGLNTIIDGLPEDLGEGVLIIQVQTTSPAGVLAHKVVGLDVFRPGHIPEKFSSVTGWAAEKYLGCVIQDGGDPERLIGRPNRIDYINGAITEMSTNLSRTANVRVTSCIQIGPPATIAGTSYSKGLLAIAHEHTTPSNQIKYVDVYDIHAGTRVAAHELAIGAYIGNGSNGIMICPLPNQFTGYGMCYEQNPGQSYVTMKIDNYDLSGGPGILVESGRTVVPLSMSPVKFSTNPAFFVGFRTTDASDEQLRVYQAEPSDGATPSVLAVSAPHSRLYTHADYGAFVSTYTPDSCLAVQQFPEIPSSGNAGASSCAIILGDIDATSLTDADGPPWVDDCVLAYINGPASNNPLAVTLSHPQRSALKAFGLCCDEARNVYVTATGDIVGDRAVAAVGTEGKILCKYDDGMNLIASVTWSATDSTLGGYAADAGAVRLSEPMWVGDRVMVVDYSTEATRLFMFYEAPGNSALVQIGSALVISDQSGELPRLQGQSIKFGNPWWASKY